MPIIRCPLPQPGEGNPPVRALSGVQHRPYATYPASRPRLLNRGADSRRPTCPAHRRFRNTFEWPRLPTINRVRRRCSSLRHQGPYGKRCRETAVAVKTPGLFVVSFDLNRYWTQVNHTNKHRNALVRDMPNFLSLTVLGLDMDLSSIYRRFLAGDFWQAIARTNLLFSIGWILSLWRSG